MTTKLTRTAAAEGVFLSAYRDPKFKHNRLTVNMVVPLARETAAEYAIIPFLMRKGSQDCPDFTRLNRRLDELYGASLSADIGKTGASQVIALGIKMVDDRFTIEGEEMVRRCSELLRSLVFSPLIENGAFSVVDTALERRYLIDTIEAEINDKRSYAMAQLRTLMDGDNPAALRRYGTVEAVGYITPESAAKSYTKLMDNAAVEIMFVGSGDPSAAFEVLGNAFSNLSRRPQPFSQPQIIPCAAQVHERTEHLEVAQSKLVLGFRTGGRGSQSEQAAMRMMTALYGGTPFSKLFLNVRERLSLCYYCTAHYDRSFGIMAVDCGVEKNNIERAKEEIFHQLEEVQKGLFDEETLENTRLMMKNILRSVGDSTSALEEWYLNRIITGEITSPQQELLFIDEVTREQVIEAAKKISLDAVYLLTGKEEAPDAQ